jgi:ribosome-associated translation inhibitor RaiA
MTTTIRLNVQPLNLRAARGLEAWIERQVQALGAARRIDEARIHIARLENASPAYEVRAHLVTPGPDLIVNGRDHTLRAAFSKVIDLLRGQIAWRAEKSRHRTRTNQHVTTPRGHRSRGL